MQSNLESQAPTARHVAVVMDGNGRWGARRGLDRSAGHRAGADAVERIVEAAPGLGIEVLTLFAFSSDNWQRPRGEVNQLMRLVRTYVRAQRARCIANGVRVSVIGRRDRLSAPVLRAIERAEHATRAGRRLHLRIAVDYSARDAIAEAARRWARSPTASTDDLGRMIAQGDAGAPPMPELDLLIRTGGEQRLSDFLLWECAYAELYFVERLWPDFDTADLAAALDDFRRRERRFGRVAAPSARDRPAAPPPRSSREWVDYFVANRAALRPIPWSTGADLDPRELVAIAESVRKFQLGEKGEGSSLMRYARVEAERSGDPAYVDAARLLIAEEHRHSQDLGRFMALNGIPELRRTWTDDVFRRLRNVLGTLEVSIAVLVTAEILAKAYYPILHDATRSAVLRALCTQIVSDEHRHVEFQCQQLAKVRAGRGRIGLLLTRTLQRLLFFGTMVVVGIDHRRALRASGSGVTGFWRAAWTTFAGDLAAMAPVTRPPERPWRTVMARTKRISILGGHA
jgi:undecaprenyl diphosphate synthase